MMAATNFANEGACITTAKGNMKNTRHMQKRGLMLKRQAFRSKTAHSAIPSPLLDTVSGDQLLEITDASPSTLRWWPDARAKVCPACPVVCRWEDAQMQQMSLDMQSLAKDVLGLKP